MSIRINWKWGIPITLLAGVAAYAAYEEFTMDGSEPPRLADALALRPGLTVAEIGAGKGKMAVEMARRLEPGGALIATEIEQKKRDSIQRRAREHGLSNVQVVEADEHSTNLPDRCCDAIFMRHVYHHFTDPDALARSLFRALKPGGRIGIVDTDGKLWFLPRPNGVPSNRGGHGMPLRLLIGEMTQAGFTLVSSQEKFSRGAYLAVFSKP